MAKARKHRARVTEMRNATMTIPEAARLLGIGLNQAYVAAARGDIPILRIGKRMLVLREPFERMLGLEPGSLTGGSVGQAEKAPGEKAQAGQSDGTGRGNTRDTGQAAAVPAQGHARAGSGGAWGSRWDAARPI